MFLAKKNKIIGVKSPKVAGQLAFPAQGKGLFSDVKSDH
jgi:hypothetical protein